MAIHMYVERCPVLLSRRRTETPSVPCVEGTAETLGSFRSRNSYKKICENRDHLNSQKKVNNFALMIHMLTAWISKRCFSYFVGGAYYGNKNLISTVLV